MKVEKFWIWAVRSLVKISAMAFAVFFFVVACVPVIFPPWESEPFADHLKFKRVIASVRGIFSGNCAIAFLELDEKLAYELREGGIERLNFIFQKRDTASSGASPAIVEWRPVPIDDNGSLPNWPEILARHKVTYRDNLQPSNHCRADDKPLLEPREYNDFIQSMTTAKAYYAIVSTGYGLAIIVPELGRVGVFYSY